MADYDAENGRYEGEFLRILPLHAGFCLVVSTLTRMSLAEEARFDRMRSASPRDEPRGDRARSRSPNGRFDDRYAAKSSFHISPPSVN